MNSLVAQTVLSNLGVTPGECLDSLVSDVILCARPCCFELGLFEITGLFCSFRWQFSQVVLFNWAKRSCAISWLGDTFSLYWLL